MKKRITPQQIADLERRIASAQTTAADVDLMRQIIAQVTNDCSERMVIQ